MTTAAVSMTMRDAFIGAICDAMAHDERIIFVAADFGAPALDRLRKDFPRRFINVGIAEQNLINISSGLALEGYKVFAYAIAPFITMRAYEQSRVNLAISSQIKPVNVNLIGVGAGLSYDMSGPTHHCVEDITIMRLLPNIEVYSPSDFGILKAMTDQALQVNKPKYFRLDGKAVKCIYGGTRIPDFAKGFAVLSPGDDICIVSTGFLTHTALAVAKELPGVGVVDVFRLKPLDGGALADELKRFKHIITAEENLINVGGLDSIIQSLILKNKLSASFNNLGFDDKYVFDLGERATLHKKNGMDISEIARFIQQLRGNA